MNLKILRFSRTHSFSERQTLEVIYYRAKPYAECRASQRSPGSSLEVRAGIALPQGSEVHPCTLGREDQRPGGIIQVGELDVLGSWSGASHIILFPVNID